jgi:nucleotide-binding universal stress UspA family protein
MAHEVLLPLDESTESDRALPVATALARQTGAPLRLIRVLTTSVGTVTQRVGALGAGDALREMCEAAEAELTRRAAELRTDMGIEVGVVVVTREDPAAALLDYLRSRAVSTIVMATRGRGGVARALLGSVADRVMRASPVPVVLVPPAAAGPEHAGEIRRVLVPLDGSPVAADVLRALASLSLAGEVTFVLLEVVQPMLVSGVAAPPALRDPAAMRSEEADAHARLAQAAPRLAGAGHTVETRVAIGEDAGAAIGEAARRERVDLIAMATHGRGGLGRAVMGSVADAVVRGGGTIPILLVHPRSTDGRPT